jgi:hypothetical protein
VKTQTGLNIWRENFNIYRLQVHLVDDVFSEDGGLL